MSQTKFEKLDELEGGDKVEIELSDKGNAHMGDVSLKNPLRTTVEFVNEERLDENEGDDVDGVVTKKTIYLEVPDYDDRNGEYVIITESPMVGDNRVQPLQGREYFEGVPENGKHSIDQVRFRDIEIIN